MDKDSLTKFAANSVLQTTRQAGKWESLEWSLQTEVVKICGVSLKLSVNMTLDATRTR